MLSLRYTILESNFALFPENELLDELLERVLLIILDLCLCLPIEAVFMLLLHLDVAD